MGIIYTVTWVLVAVTWGMMLITTARIRRNSAEIRARVNSIKESDSRSARLLYELSLAIVTDGQHVGAHDDCEICRLIKESLL